MISKYYTKTDVTKIELLVSIFTIKIIISLELLSNNNGVYMND